jgi:hypothetical protein
VRLGVCIEGNAGVARGDDQVILGGAGAQKRLNNCVLASACAQN